LKNKKKRKEKQQIESFLIRFCKGP